MKLLIEESDWSKGDMYSWSADSISHSDGDAVGLKSENVRWYVGAYLKALVDCLSKADAVSGDSDFIFEL